MTTESRKDVPVRHVSTIEAYRAARAAGNTRMIPFTDGYGNVLISIEQDVLEPFTHEKTVNIAPNLKPSDIQLGIENITKIMNEGGAEGQGEMGIEAMLKNAESQRKQAEAYEKQAAERKAKFADRILDLEALLADAVEVETAAKAAYDKKLEENAKALEAKIKDKEPQRSKVEAK
jgi:hypothetical protein